MEGSDYINASFIDVSCWQRVKSNLHHSACVWHRDMVAKSMHILPLKVSPLLRVRICEQLCNMYICTFSLPPPLLSFSTRTTARVIGTVLEDGVGAPATHYCDAHQLCGGWEGESRDVCPLDTASCVVHKSTILHRRSVPNTGLRMCMAASLLDPSSPSPSPPPSHLLSMRSKSLKSNV